MATCPHRNHHLEEPTEAKSLLRQNFDRQVREVCMGWAGLLNCKYLLLNTVAMQQNDLYLKTFLHV